jgi:pilus assembly protein Flp/PilA
MLNLNYVRAIISTFARRVTRTDEGASMVEYALLLALIAVVCIAAVTLLGQSANDKFTDVSNAVNGA